MSLPEMVAPREAVPPLFLGVDVGGTNLKLGLVDDLGRVLAQTSIPTHEERGPRDAVARIAEATRELLREQGLALSDLAAAGLGSPGTMDIAAGLILEPHNLPHWHRFPIREALGQALGLPVWFANDGNAAAWGEYWVGGGRDHHSLVLLTLGTGVGGGIIYGDLSIDGEHSHGSECGHIIIDCNDTARLCQCGRRGHLEGYCSATALVRRTEELLAAGRTSSLAARISPAEPLTALMIAEEAERGDALARETIFELATYLAVGVTSLIHAINPSVIILGGAMNFGAHEQPLGREFLGRVRQVVRELAFPIPGEKTVIDFAALGGSAGFIGAAALARRGRKTER